MKMKMKMVVMALNAPDLPARRVFDKINPQSEMFRVFLERNLSEFHTLPLPRKAFKKKKNDLLNRVACRFRGHRVARRRPLISGFMSGALHILIPLLPCSRAHGVPAH